MADFRCAFRGRWAMPRLKMAAITIIVVFLMFHSVGNGGLDFIAPPARVSLVYPAFHVAWSPGLCSRARPHPSRSRVSLCFVLVQVPPLSLSFDSLEFPPAATRGEVHFYF